MNNHEAGIEPDQTANGVVADGIGSQHLTVASGSSARRVPVCAVPGQPRQPPPGIVWLGGFTSDMHGMNAEYLGRFAARAPCRVEAALSRISPESLLGHPQLRPVRARGSAAGEPQNQRQDHTDQEPSGDREIEREVLMLDNDIAGQTP
jgi:hypothetical protein